MKATQACHKIIEESKNSKVEVELLDLGKLKSIKDFSDRIKTKLDRLDVLINNAGYRSFSRINLKNYNNKLDILLKKV